jgi:ABC-type amino acid transport substrate-binding protein
MLCVATGAAGAPTAATDSLTVALRLPDHGFQVGAVRGRQVTFASGYEVDLARALALRIGAGSQVQFVHAPGLHRLAAGPKPWDFALARLQTRRAPGVEFSDPYLHADQAVLARRGLRRPRALADLGRLQLCALRGSRGADVIAGRIVPLSRPLAARDDAELVGWVETGRCDAALREAPALGVALRSTGARVGQVVGRIETGAAYVIGLPRGSELTWRVNDALAVFRVDGTLRRLAERWFGFDPSRLRVLS